MLAEPFNVIRRLDAISTRRGGAERGPSILPKRKVVFVVDDDPGTLKGVKRLLREHGFDCVLFQSAEALKKYFFLLYLPEKDCKHNCFSCNHAGT